MKELILWILEELFLPTKIQDVNLMLELLEQWVLDWLLLLAQEHVVQMIGELMLWETVRLDLVECNAKLVQDINLAVLFLL